MSRVNNAFAENDFMQMYQGVRVEMKVPKGYFDLNGYLVHCQYASAITKHW